MARPLSPARSILAWFRRSGRAARFGAFAGILAVLLQGAAPVAHLALSAISSPDPALAAYTAAFGDLARGALCAASGDGEDDGLPSRNAAHHGLLACATCQAVQQTGLLLPTPTPTFTPVAPYRSTIVAIPAADVFSSTPTSCDAQPRAPPPLVVSRLTTTLNG